MDKTEYVKQEEALMLYGRMSVKKMLERKFLRIDSFSKYTGFGEIFQWILEVNSNLAEIQTVVLSVGYGTTLMFELYNSSYYD